MTYQKHKCSWKIKPVSSLLHNLVSLSGTINSSEVFARKKQQTCLQAVERSWSFLCLLNSRLRGLQWSSLWEVFKAYTILVWIFCSFLWECSAVLHCWVCTNSVRTSKTLGQRLKKCTRDSLQSSIALCSALSFDFFFYKGSFLPSDCYLNIILNIFKRASQGSECALPIQDFNLIKASTVLWNSGLQQAKC